MAEMKIDANGEAFLGKEAKDVGPKPPKIKLWGSSTRGYQLTTDI